MKTNSQRGFTMIELIVVIVILGILASVALPRLTNMQRDARIAKLNAARGAVAAAAAMVHGAALARQGQVQPGCLGGAAPTTIGAANGNGQVCTENGLSGVTLLYPTANANYAAGGGILFASGLIPPNAPNLASEGYATAAAAGGGLNIQVTGGTAAATCFFTYTPPAVLGGAATVSQATTTGC